MSDTWHQGPDRSRRARKVRRQSPWERFVDGAGDNRLSAVRDGLVIPAIPALFSLWWIVTGKISAGRRGRHFEIVGTDARLMGLTLFAAAFALHVHFFWSNHDTLGEYSRRAMIACAIVFFGALVGVAVF